MKSIVVIIVSVFLFSCGQQSEVVGPHQRVEFDDNLVLETEVTTQSLSGICDPGSPLVISSPGMNPSLVNLACSQTGNFSTVVNLTSGDGDKLLTVTQTDDPTNAVTVDTITVNLDQNPPVLSPDVIAAVPYGSAVIVANVLSNDIDEGRGIDPTSMVVLEDSSSGLCAVNFGVVAAVTFAPIPGFSGTAQCTYEVSDLLGNSASTTVDFTVSPGSPIVANDNLVSGSQNVPVSIDVVTNDFDPDGSTDIDSSTLTITSPTNIISEGTCSIGPTPTSLSFNPVLNFFGTAVCTYEICDFSGTCDTANFTIITSDETGPIAVKDTAVMSSGGTPVTQDVAVNDTDAAGNLEVSSVQVLSSSGGACSLSPTAPNIQFVPASGFVGLGNCGYRICDTELNCTSGVFEVTVNDGQGPLINNDSVSTTANVIANPVNVSVNDLDPENQLDLSSVTIVSASELNGTCAVTTSPLVVFTPATDFVGSGGCDYQICDQSSNCSQASINVVVTDINAPTANDDSHSTNQNVVATAFDVSANDTDLENQIDNTSVTLTGIESGGTCGVSSPNVTFTPDLNFAGLGSCGYRVCDLSGNCSQANLNVTVSDVAAPTVTIDQLTPGQQDPASATPISFSVVFSEEINAATLSSSDIDNTGTTAVGGVYSFVNTGDNINFILQVNALASGGVVQVSLPAGSFEDSNGVLNTAASTNLDNSVTFDNTPPLKPVILNPAFTSNLNPDIDVSCEPGSLIQLNESSLSPNPYPAVPTVCPGGGSLSFTSVPLTGGGPYNVLAIASDEAGNQTPGDLFLVTIDGTGPDLDLVILSGQATSTNTLPIFFEASFNEPINPSTFTSADITNTGTASGGVWTILNSGDNQNYTLSVNALTSDGTVTPFVAASLITDPAGNQNNAATSSGVNTVTYDGTVPLAPIITAPFFTQDSTPDLIVDCDNNESLEFVITPFTGTNPVLASCSAGSAIVSVPSVIGADGTYTILPTAIDGVGNRTDGNLFTLVLDSVQPSPTITLNAGQGSLTNTTPVFFDVVWDEAIGASSFTGVDITNTGTATGGVWSVSNSGDSQNFIISITSLTGDGTVVPQINASLVNDPALNTNLMGAYVGTPVIVDTQAPSQPVVTNPVFTTTPTPAVDITCDPAATDVILTIPGYVSSPFSAGACGVGGTLSVVLPTALSAQGVFSITPSSEDAAGNVITGLPFKMTFDQSAPAVTINRLASQPVQSNLLPISFEVVFSEAIETSSFTASDITEINAGAAPGGAWSITNSGDNQNFTISKSGLTGDGFVQPQIGIGLVNDLASLSNTAVNSIGVNGDTVEYKATPPGTPTVISPAFTSDTTPTINVNCELGATIQLAITGYTPNPFPAVPVDCLSSPVSITLSPAVATDGIYTVRAIASDSIGNESISSPFDMVLDTVEPNVVISQSGGQLDPTRLQPIKYDIVFSEAIDATSFTAVDISNTGSTNGLGSWSISNSGDNQNFVISISGLTGDGTVIPNVGLGLVSDNAGNTNTVATAGGDIEVAYDGTPPGIPSVLSPRYTNDNTPTLNINCDLGSDVQIQNAFINSGSPFPVTPVACTSSPVSINITTLLPDADYIITPLASDAVGNISFGSSFTVTVDTVNPDVTIDRLTSVTPDRTNAEPVVFSVAFSEVINKASFTSASITNAVGALAPGLWSITNSGDDQNFTISASALVGEGNVIPEILAAAVQDLAGNNNNAFSVLNDGDVYFDNIAPTNPDILSWTWGLSSPLDGSFSTDSTPQISLSGAGSEESGTIQMYNDVSCITPEGSSSAILSSNSNITDIAYLVDGTDDGLKDFFTKITDDVGNESNCVPVSLSYTFDTQAPFATVSQALTQQDPADDLNLFFEVLFNEPIDPLTFTEADLSHTGTIPSLSLAIVNSGDDTKFSVTVSSPDTGGTVVLELATASVSDKAGNINTASVYPDNSISYPCANPEAIDDLYYGPVTKTTVDLFWTPKADSGCQPVADYEIEYREVGDVSWTVFSDTVTADPLATVTGLDFNTQYEFRIRSFNDLFSDHSNITVTTTKPDTPFFDPTDYKLINLTGAVDSTVVALEDGTDIFVTNDVNDPSPMLLASLDAGETHRFSSPQAPGSLISRDDILISNKPIFASGRVGADTFSCSGSGNPLWVPPLWSEKVLLFNASRNSPQTIYVFAFEDANVTVFRNNAVVVPSTFIAANTIGVLTAAGVGAFRIESDAFIAASRHGTSFIDDMPALPRATQIMGYPSNAGLLSTVSVGTVATLSHSDGFSLITSVSPSAFTSMSPRGPTTSLYRSEALFIEATDLISASNTADSDGCNSAPFNPIHLMMRRYAVNVDAQYVAFASTVGATVRMTRPDGTVSEFDLVRTGAGPFALRSPYKFYLTNVPGGTLFEGLGPQDRFSVWYQSDTKDGAGYEDETIVYGYK